MGEDRDRKMGMPQPFALRGPQTGNRGRTYRHRRKPVLRRLYTVVDTPRRASSSITRSGNHRIALFIQFLHHRIGCGKTWTSLAALDNGSSAVLIDEHLGDVVGQMIEVGLGVAEAANQL